MFNSNLTLEMMLNEIKSEVEAYNAEYLIKHPHDWDCCGFANLRVFFGRKRKLKSFMTSLGLIDENHSYSNWQGSYYHIQIPREYVPSVGHQSLTYKEDVQYVIRRVIRKYIEFGDLVLDVNSFMD